MTITEKWQEYERLLSITDFRYQMPTATGSGRSRKFKGPNDKEIRKHRRHFDKLRAIKRELQKIDPQRTKELLNQYSRGA